MANRQVAINKGDFLDWKRNPVTQNYLEMLKNELEDLKESLANGQTVDTENLHKTAVRTIEIVSKIRMIKDILSINEVDVDA